jgi:HSP20 family protein
MTMMEFAPWVRELNRIFGAENQPAAFIPPADVLVSETGVNVHMDVPGMRAEDLDIELENDTLTVRGERRFPYQTEPEQRVWRHIERRFGRFERTLRVPGGLNPDAVEATMADGVLTLSIPRPESPRPHRVQIRAGSAGDGRTQPTVEGSQTGAGARMGASESQPGTQTGDAQTQPAGTQSQTEGTPTGAP